MDIKGSSSSNKHIPQLRRQTSEELYEHAKSKENKKKGKGKGTEGTMKDLHYNFSSSKPKLYPYANILLAGKTADSKLNTVSTPLMNCS